MLIQPAHCAVRAVREQRYVLADDCCGLSLSQRTVLTVLVEDLSAGSQMLNGCKLFGIAGDDELRNGQTTAFVGAHGVAGVGSRAIRDLHNHYLSAGDILCTDI